MSPTALWTWYLSAISNISQQGRKVLAINIPLKGIRRKAGVDKDTYQPDVVSALRAN